MPKLRHNVINVWSWVSAERHAKSLYVSKRHSKPVTRREDVIAKAIGEILAKARAETGLSAREVANIMGISQAQVTYYELGQDAIALPLLFEFSDLYDIDVGRLFDAATKVSVSNKTNIKKVRKNVADAIRNRRGRSGPRLNRVELIEIQSMLVAKTHTIRMLAEEYSVATTTLYTLFNGDGSLKALGKKRLA